MKHENRFLVGVLSIIAVSLSVIWWLSPRPAVAASVKTTEAPPQLKIIDYKNGVYYFPWSADTYMRKLSEFKEKHPELEFVCAEPIVGSSFGGSVGTCAHVVHFRDKK